MSDDSLRETLSKSFDQVAKQESGGTDGIQNLPDSSTPAPDSKEVTAPDSAIQAPAPAPKDGEGTPGGQTSAPGSVDDKTNTEQLSDDKTTSSPAPAPEAAGNFEKAPGTWGVESRETWKDIPPAARKEIWKREKDATRALTISSDARKLKMQFEETMKPYLGFIAAEGGTPLQAVDYMMRTAALFRVGSPSQKAQAVAGIIKQWGIDVQMLDGLLAGEPAATNPADMVRTEVQRALQPLIQQGTARQQAITQEIEQEVNDELAAFAADPKHEFYNDVREDMADIIELAKGRGRKVSLTEAYERAILLSEPVRRTIEARKSREQAQRNQQIADQARRTASSVPGTAVGSGNSVTNPGDDLRATIEAAFNKHSG